MSKAKKVNSDAADDDKVRLDKWLWAARFFKTRALAKEALEGGKVHYNGVRGKASRVVELGAILKIRQGLDEKIVEVTGLSGQRRGAPEAATLYAETAESLEQRQRLADQRKALKGATPGTAGRPNKRDRRRIQEFKDYSDLKWD